MSSNKPQHASRSELFEAEEDTPVNPSVSDTLGDIIQRRFSRRDFLRGSLAVPVVGGLLGSSLAALGSSEGPNTDDSPTRASGRFAFAEIAHGVDENHHVRTRLRRRHPDTLGR